MTTFRTSAPLERAFTPRGPQRHAIRKQMHGDIKGLSDIRRPSFINKFVSVLKGRPALSNKRRATFQ